MNFTKTVTLLLLVLNCMAQTLPRPTGLYFEPLLDGQSGIMPHERWRQDHSPDCQPWDDRKTEDSS